MSFADVHGQEIGTVAVITVELGEMAHLATKRRSSVASENEDERARSDVVVELERGLAVERNQSHVGRRIADAQIAAMPLGKGVTKEAVDVARASHEMAEDAVASQQDCDERDARPFQRAHESGPPRAKRR